MIKAEPFSPGFNFLVRMFGHENIMDSRIFHMTHSSAGSHGRVQTPANYLHLATSRAISSNTDALQVLRNDPPSSYPGESFRPYLAYTREDIHPPDEFVDQCHPYTEMSPEERSEHMRGNVKMATETVLWTIADRVGSWPSLVDSAELKKVMLLELKELVETDEVKGGESVSSLDRALSRNKDSEWYLGEDAKNTWDVASEISDIAFCSMQHWLGYDGFTVHKCVEAGKSVAERFDQIDPMLTNDDLKTLVLELNSGQIGMNDYFWVEMQMGIAYLLSKRVGVDLWEMLTLKCLTNIRQYPDSMQLVEKDVERRLDEARTPAWTFMKNLRVRFNKEKRFIPPMSDAFGRETVLDQVYESPYLDAKILDFAALMEAAISEGGEYAIPTFLAELYLNDKGGNSNYY